MKYTYKVIYRYRDFLNNESYFITNYEDIKQALEELSKIENTKHIKNFEKITTSAKILKSTLKPNKETIKAINESENNINMIKCENAEDMFSKLDINIANSLAIYDENCAVDSNFETIEKSNEKIQKSAEKNLFEKFEKLQNLDYSKLSFTEREILTGNLGLLKQIENSVKEKDKEIERLTSLFKVLDDYLNQESPDPGQEKCERCSMNIKKYCAGDCYL